MHPANGVTEEESDYESNKTKRKDRIKSNGGIVAYISDWLGLFKLDSNPPSSTSSTSKSASKGNLRDSHNNQPTHEEASETVDLTLEPEDDIAFPSPLNMPQALPPTSSQSSHNMKAFSSGSRRRDPLYNEVNYWQLRIMLEAYTADSGPSFRQQKLAARIVEKGRYWEWEGSTSSYGSISKHQINPRFTVMPL